MSEFDPNLDAIMRTDRFVDALASGARMSSVDPLSSMLGAWRDDVRSRPDAHVVTLAQASAALENAHKPLRRNRFGLTVVGAAAAAVLCLGGFGAVVYNAAPGDALYGLRTMLFGEAQKSRNDAVMLAAQTELAQVQQLVQQGQWDQAQQRLVTLSTTVQSVDNTQDKQQLVEQYNALTVKVIQRDPEATLPPPGEPMPPLPSSPLTFLQVPVIEATTTPTSTQTTIETTVSTTIQTTPTSTSLPTPTSSLPTPTSSLPTPTTPSRTSTVTMPTPTPTAPSPTATAPSPTAPATSASAPPPVFRETTTAAAPPVTVTTSQAPAVVTTVTTAPAATSSAAPAPPTPKTTQPPATVPTSVVMTTPEQPTKPETPR